MSSNPIRATTPTVLAGITLLLGAGIPTPVACQARTDVQALGRFLDSVMVAEGVPGLSFAAFNDQGILYQHVAGVKNAETREPVDGETVFEAASISKTLFAYTVLSMTFDGAMDLDAPLTDLVPEIPEVGYDPRSARLTARLLLSHQGGLPNWRSRIRFGAHDYADLFDPGDTLRFLSDPGERYRYSGEGFVLLQRVVEEHTGTGLNDLVRRRVFAPLHMTRSSFLYDPTLLANSSKGHDAEGKPDKWIIGIPLASSTLHTTASDLARFGVHLAAQIRNGGPYAVMATPQVEVAKDGDRSLSWGLGLGILRAGSRTFVYHGGNNVIFIADFIYGVDDNLGYVLLTNSANGQRVVDALERRVFGRALRK